MQSIEIELKKAIQQAIQKSFDLEVSLEQIAIEIPKNKDHGDFSSNVAMQLARTLKQNPRNIATQITEALDKESCKLNSETAGYRPRC